jgi:hypothetical protein
MPVVRLEKRLGVLPPTARAEIKKALTFALDLEALSD